MPQCRQHGGTFTIRDQLGPPHNEVQQVVIGILQQLSERCDTGRIKIFEMLVHKADEQQIQLHPGQKFVLFGDTHQWDPEAYAKVREKHPDAIKAIVIHEVPDTDMNPERFQGMFVTTTALQSAEALKKVGVIDQAAVNRVRSAMG